MKRELDLIRTILLRVEADPKFNGNFQTASAATLGITDHTEAEVAYNAALLVEAGYLEGNIRRAAAGAVLVTKITWEGHDFLDSIRDPKVWAKTKRAAEGAGGFTIGLLKALAIGIMKKQVEDRTGLKL